MQGVLDHFSFRKKHISSTIRENDKKYEPLRINSSRKVNDQARRLK